MNISGSAKISLLLAFTNNDVCLSRWESWKVPGNPVAKSRNITSSNCLYVYWVSLFYTHVIISSVTLGCFYVYVGSINRTYSLWDLWVAACLKLFDGIFYFVVATGNLMYSFETASALYKNLLSWERQSVFRLQKFCL